MADGTVLGGVDVLAREHRVAVGLHSGLARQFDQQLQGFAGRAMFAVVDVQVGDLEGQLTSALRVLGEDLSQVPLGEGAVMIVQFPPCRRCGDVAAHVREGTHRRGGVHGQRSSPTCLPRPPLLSTLATWCPYPNYSNPSRRNCGSAGPSMPPVAPPSPCTIRPPVRCSPTSPTRPPRTRCAPSTRRWPCRTNGPPRPRAPAGRSCARCSTRSPPAPRTSPC
ncbi:Uncharacterised protein [Mycobacteroides abscessus subsp. abscessus]|nr:Uncharacterised protein [Mycobacteroides abscessus subsp. abscessus]